MLPADTGLADPRAYVRLAAIVRQQIIDGTLERGQPAPSITRLSQEHGHARPTCAKALRMLEGEGLLDARWRQIYPSLRQQHACPLPSCSARARAATRTRGHASRVPLQLMI
ncbi:MAG TPA: GntR family transcriptional regulator [Streptosporangiaceae bacterium]